MKPTLKTLALLPLLLALVAAPLCAEPIDSGTIATNPTVLAAPIPPPPEPPAPPEPDANPSTNKSSAKSKRNQSSDDHVPVRIGPDGIHIGGPDPVDINVPDFSRDGGAKSVMFWSGFMLPIVCVITVFGFLAFVIGYFLYLRHRRHRILHETIRTMIEKGVPIPPELLAPPEPTPVRRTRSDLRSGLILIGVGFGMVIAMRGTLMRLGWIPILIGVAFLIAWFIQRKNNNNNGGPTIT